MMRIMTVLRVRVELLTLVLMVTLTGMLTKVNYAPGMRYFLLRIRKVILHVLEAIAAVDLWIWKVPEIHGMRVCI